MYSAVQNVLPIDVTYEFGVRLKIFFFSRDNIKNTNPQLGILVILLGYDFFEYSLSNLYRRIYGPNITNLKILVCFER